jgi:ubiquinone/menaquinone biosynthesis C-methylase UbiE
MLRDNLRDLERVNRWLGGARLSTTTIEALAGVAPDLTVLDVGTGGADIPMILLDRAARRGHRWQVTGIDTRPEILAAAAVRDARLTATPGLVLQVADGRALPFADRSFDVVHTSLVAHHLEADDVVRLFTEMGRVARLGIVVNDLVRSELAWIGAWVMAHTLTRSRFTRHDAPLSVSRAFTRPELTELARAAGLHIVARSIGLAGHRWAFAARSSLT